MNSTQDWFMMTGDLIINLKSTKTGDNGLSFKKKFQKSLNETLLLSDKTLLDNNQNQSKNENLDYKATLENNNASYKETFNDHSELNDLAEQSCLNEKILSSDINNEENFNKKITENDYNHTLKKNTLVSSNSSSGNSSGNEELSNSQVYSDSASLASESRTPCINVPQKQFFSLENGVDIKTNDHCYENIKDCQFLSDSQESNLYNLIEDHSKSSLDNVSYESDNSILVYSNSNKSQFVDEPSAVRLAQRLYDLDGFKKQDVANHLCKNNDFSRTVADSYLKLFDFTGLGLDEALRHFLSRFFLIGETQERERVLVYFSKRYSECNPNNTFKNVDSIHTLTCALMLLNTDLHEKTILRKMTCSNFLMNLNGLNDGENYSINLLKYLYYSVKNNPLGWIDDDQDTVISKNEKNIFSKTVTKSKSDNTSYATIQRKASEMSFNPFIEIPNPTFAIEYKKGYVRRKCCYEVDGKKTSFGKRKWKLFYATLRDLVLYLHRDENGFRKSQLQESFSNSIRIHHSIASVANDYFKKKFVFRLITADYAEYLFETSDSKELESWVDTINTTTAILSAPTLPMAVSSDKHKFKKEIFPVSHTKLSLKDQLANQENKLLNLQIELENLLEKSEKKSQRTYKNFLEKETYLQHEIKRYRVYVSCLKRQLKKQIEQHNLHQPNFEDESSKIINSNNNNVQINWEKNLKIIS